MVEQRITCDRCGETIKADRTLLTPECGPLRESGRPPIDLCPDCAGALLDWLGAGAEAPSLVLSGDR